MTTAKKGSRLTEAECERIVALRRRGHTQQHVARVTGRSLHAIQRVLDASPLERFSVRPTPKRMTRRGAVITRLAQQGLSTAEIAQRMGLSLCAVRMTVHDYALFEATGLTSLPAVAAEIGMTSAGLRRAVKLGRVPHTRWFTNYVFSPEQIEQVKEVLLALEPDHAKHWLTSHQAARELGLSRALFLHLRRRGHPVLSAIPQRRVQGGRRRIRYDPQATLRAARELTHRPWDRPSTTALSTGELAALVHRNPATVQRWASEGLPHTRNAYGCSGRLYIEPDAAVRWLEQQSAVPRLRAAASLRRALAPLERAA